MGLSENINWYDFISKLTQPEPGVGMMPNPVFDTLAKAKERQMNKRDIIDTNAAQFQSYDPYIQQYLDNYLKSLKSTGLAGMIGGNNGTL